MSGEEKTPGAKPGTPEEYSHKVYSAIRFTSHDNLELAQIGLELLHKAINNELEEQEKDDE